WTASATCGVTMASSAAASAATAARSDAGPSAPSLGRLTRTGRRSTTGAGATVSALMYGTAGFSSMYGIAGFSTTGVSDAATGILAAAFFALTAAASSAT